MISPKQNPTIFKKIKTPKKKNQKKKTNSTHNTKPQNFSYFQNPALPKNPKHQTLTPNPTPKHIKNQISIKNFIKIPIININKC